MRVEGGMELPEVSIVLGEFRTLNCAYAGDSGGEAEDLAVLLLEDDRGRARLERVVYADRLALLA